MSCFLQASQQCTRLQGMCDAAKHDKVVLDTQLQVRECHRRRRSLSHTLSVSAPLVNSCGPHTLSPEACRCACCSLPWLSCLLHGVSLC
jgi:hypothetical protein